MSTKTSNNISKKNTPQRPTSASLSKTPVGRSWKKYVEPAEQQPVNISIQNISLEATSPRSPTHPHSPKPLRPQRESPKSNGKSPSKPSPIQSNGSSLKEQPLKSEGSSLLTIKQFVDEYSESQQEPSVETSLSDFPFVASIIRAPKHPKPGQRIQPQTEKPVHVVSTTTRIPYQPARKSIQVASKAPSVGSSFNKKKLKTYSQSSLEKIQERLSLDLSGVQSKSAPTSTMSSVRTLPSRPSSAYSTYSKSSNFSRFTTDTEASNTSVASEKTTQQTVEEAQHLWKEILEVSPDECSFVILQMTSLEDNSTPRPQPTKYQRTVINNILKEQMVLAQTAKRSQNFTEEASCYFRMATLTEKFEKYDKSVEYYENYLAVVKSSSNVLGQALAFNRLANCYYIMNGEENVKKAVSFSSQHLELTKDSGSRFIAHCNLGICYTTLNELDQCIYHFRQSLGYAIQLGDLEAQNLVCDHLSTSSFRKRDFAVTTLYLNRRLKIAELFGDYKLLAAIHHQLGGVYYEWKGKGCPEGKQAYEEAITILEDNCNSDGAQKSFLEMAQAASDMQQYDEAISYFEKAIVTSQMLGDEQTLNAAKCGIGLAQGNKRMQALFNSKQSINSPFSSFKSFSSFSSIPATTGMSPFNSMSSSAKVAWE